jgi:hypothetical protein
MVGCILYPCTLKAQFFPVKVQTQGRVYYQKVIKRGTGKIHLRLVAQAFQPVHLRVAGRRNMNDPQFFKMLFMKEYQDDIFQI